MATLTAPQIAALALEAGWSPDDATTATAIALAESGGDTAVLGDEHLQTAKWGPSVGVWQVRSLVADTGTGRTRDRARLPDPTFNAASAFTISGRGSSWQPWSMYSNGTYRDHLDTARAAVAQAATDPGIIDSIASIVGGGVTLPFPGIPWWWGSAAARGGAAAAPGAAQDAAADAVRAQVARYGLGWATTPEGRRAALAVTGGLLVAGAGVILWMGDDLAGGAAALAGNLTGGA